MRKIRLIVVGLGLIAFAVPSSPATATGSVWTQVTGLATAPSARFGHAMAFDQNNGVSVLFGGCTGLTSTNIRVTMTDGRTADVPQDWCTQGSEPNDTWIWTASGTSGTWTRVIASGVPGSPNARWSASMTYDYKSKSIILFGGLWQSDTQSSAPADSSLCFKDPPDEGQKQLLPSDSQEIGGVTSVEDLNTGRNHYYYCFQDTWKLTKVAGTWAWSKLTPTHKPPTRFDAGMSFDGQGRPTLAGGCHQMGMTGAHGAPNTPTYWGCAEYAAFEVEYQDSCPLGLIDWSYCSKTEADNIDSWRLVWSGNPALGGTPDWVPIGCQAPPRPPATPCAPSELSGMTFTFDPASHKITLFGGWYYDPNVQYGGYQQETWQYDDAADQWIRLLQGGAHDQWCPSLSAATAWSTATFVSIAGHWQVQQYGGKGKFFTPWPSCPNDDHTMDTRWYAAGGRPGNVREWADTWRWDSANCIVGSGAYQTMCWHWGGDAGFASGTPGGLQSAGAAYNNAVGRIVMFGGLTPSGSSGSTWVSGDGSVAADPCLGC